MSLVVGTIEELECRLNAFGVALVGAPLGRQLIEALARAEKAEAKLRRQASTMAHRLDEVANAAERTLESLGIIRLRDAVQRARIANGAEPGSDYADLLNRAEKAETDAAASWQFAELARVKAKEAGDCVFCKGTGRSCGNKHCGWPWCASCKACNGTGRKTEESDGKSTTEEQAFHSDTNRPDRGKDHPGQGARRGDSPDGERVGQRREHGAEPERAEATGGSAAQDPVKPPGVPASATIWAEVVDGLGRKVGAWFVPPFMKGDLGHVDMYDPEQPSAPWAWSPRCDSQWKGSFDERLTPSAAAQCRQLYEKGLAHLAAEATHQALAEDLEDYRPSAEELAAAADARGEEVPKVDKTDRWGVNQEADAEVGRLLGNMAGPARPLPTLTAVDLTELREAANKRRDYLALSIDARSPLQETLNDRAVLAAVEKLLSSSGGAP